MGTTGVSRGTNNSIDFDCSKSTTNKTSCGEKQYHVVSALLPSPIKARDPAEEETAHDRRCFEENVGASDSEDDLVSDDESLPNLEDQAAFAEANLAAELTDYVSVKVEDGHQEPWCYGAPIGWTPSGAPKDWKLPAPSISKGDSESFDGIDNPGGWDHYSFQAKYDKRKPSGSGKQRWKERDKWMGIPLQWLDQTISQ